jgi:hypothetical protein
VQYALKHAFAECTVVFAATTFAVVAYFGLLAWAVLAGELLGGPLAVPFAMIAATLAVTVAAIAVFWPVTTLGGFPKRSTLPRHVASEIPIDAALRTGYLIVVAVLVSRGSGDQAARGACDRDSNRPCDDAALGPPRREAYNSRIPAPPGSLRAMNRPKARFVGTTTSRARIMVAGSINSTRGA